MDKPSNNGNECICADTHDVTRAHPQVAHAFLEAMPFVSLLVVFFGVVAIIEEQHIFTPIINIVLGLPTDQQPAVSQVSSQEVRQRYAMRCVLISRRNTTLSLG
jgi:hypothetical protein